MAKNLPAMTLALVAAFVLLSASGLATAEDPCLGKMNESGLIACLPSVSGASPLPPSDKCCAALSKADLSCLCKFKDSPRLSQMGIKPELAKQLPAKCKLNMPSECN